MSSERVISPQEIARQAIEVLSSTEATKLHFTSRIDFFQKKIEQWNSSSWRVGLIGITSSGKSTLVNGLLGEELLPSHVKPSSNCLIMTRYGIEKKVVKYYEDGIVQEVTTNLKQELDELGNELKNPTNNKKILHLSVYSPGFKLNPNIKLCDTPGLEAYNLPHHDEITINSILPSLDLVLYISNVRLAAQENNRIVKLISETKKPLIWVLNCVDVIKEKTEKDGVVSKTREQVVSEYLKKVQDNLYNSGLTDPLAVPIVFVSSREALRIAEYEQSGFEEFINTLHGQIDRLEPKFISGRLKQISNEIAYIIEAENRQESNKEMSFQNDRDEQIKQLKELESIKNKNIRGFNLLCSDFDSRKRGIVNSLHHLSNTSITEANHLRSQAQTVVSEVNQRLNHSIIDMNSEFKRIRKQNNILNEDFFHKLSSSTPSIQFKPADIKEQTRTRRVEKKPILGLGLRKLWGKIWGNDFGYDVYEETVLEIENIDQFKHNLENGLEYEMKWLQDSRDQSISALENYCQTVLNVLESRIRSIEEALRYVIPEQTQRQVLNQLQGLQNLINTTEHQYSATGVDTSIDDLPCSSLTSRDESLIEIDHLEMSLLRFLNSAANSIYQMHIDSLCGVKPDSNKSRIVICHWNYALFNEFWLRYFPNEKVPNEHYTRVKSGAYEITVIDDSLEDRKDFDNIARNIDWQNSSLFLMVPVSQIGFFQKQFFKSKAAKHFKKSRQIISVIADFSDFIDNDNLTEYLLAFSEFLHISGLKPDHIIVNYDDLGLGRVIETILKGDYRIINERDEIEFIDRMDREGHFLNVDVKNRIAYILPEWRNCINDK